jgi:cytochrome P450
MIAKESMRLYPPAYALGRQAVEECEIGGFRVPAGAQVFMFQWATQRDVRFFAQPEAFQPERWTEDFSDSLPKYAYFPFGGGPRARLHRKLFCDDGDRPVAGYDRPKISLLVAA